MSTMRAAAIVLGAVLSSAAMAQVTIDGPLTPWRLTEDERATEILVANGATASTIRVVRSKLVDGSADKGTRLSTKFVSLASDAACTPKDSIKLDPNTRKTLWLCIDKSFTADGVFSGSVEVEAGSELKPLTFVAQQSGAWSRMWGVAALAIGVWLSWLVLFYLRGKLSRDQALLPAALLSQRVAAMEARLDTAHRTLAPVVFAGVQAQLDKVADSLLIPSLDLQQFVPPPVPIQGFVVKTAEYQAFLQQQSKALDKFEAILTNGVERLASLLSQNPPLKSNPATAALVTEINSAALATDLTAANSQLAAAWSQWQTAVSGGPAAAPARTAAIRLRGSATPSALLTDIRRIAMTSWAVWAVFTVIAGYIALIAMSPGFGGGLDLARCLLWGFGFPVAGQSIQQLSVSSINTQLGITR